jgi:L-threonylcarbamoyladenylate synthase
MNPPAPSPLTDIDEAVRLLASGALCALPTETVYGLAAKASDGEAVARIYEVKGRPRFNPLIVHLASLESARDVVMFDDCALRLAERYWPGPLTLVLPAQPEAAVSGLAAAGLDTLAVRMPAHPAMRAVIEKLGSPIVAPSANRSGRLSPTCAEDVIEEFGGTVPVLDGGPCEEGIESTIVSLTKSRPTLLRPGAVPAEAIEAVLGHPLGAPGGGIEAPGMLASHYAPKASIRLNAECAEPGEALLGFGGTKGAVLDLSPSGDLREAAANLFAYLRRLDRDHDKLAVATIPQTGLGHGINDRLKRAAAPRE